LAKLTAAFGVIIAAASDDTPWRCD